MPDERGTAPVAARLHPNRGPGIGYAALAVLVLAIVLAGAGTNLTSGRPVLALVVLAGGAGVAGFLAVLAAAILGPALVVGPDGVRGRVSPRRRVDLGWDQTSITAPTEPPRARLVLELGVETFEVSPRTWVGFADLVLVLATTPAALERMSREAVEELVRLLDVEGPSTTADVPDAGRRYGDPADPGPVPTAERSSPVPLPLPRRARLALPALAALLALAGLTAPPAVAATGAPVVSRSSGRCLSLDQGRDDPGTPLVIENCDGRPGQSWTYEDTDGDGRPSLTTAGGTLCLDGRSDTEGLPVVVEPCTGSPTQVVSANPLGYVQLGRSQTRCPTVRGPSTKAGTPVELRPCADVLAAEWRSPTLPADTQPPTAPTDLAVSDLTCSSATLQWTDGRDGAEVARWADLYHDGQLITSVPGSSSRQSLRIAVKPGVPWGVYVNSRDKSANVSAASATLALTPPACAPDRTPPTRPTGLSATVVGGSGVRLRWTASSDANGVRTYIVHRNGVTVGRVTGAPDLPTETTFLDSGLTTGRTYTYTVYARDPLQNQSPVSDAVTATPGTGCLVCTVRTVARDSDLPWGLTTLPGGTVLYGRRDAGQLVLLDPASSRQTVVTGTLPDLAGTDGEGGLLGLAVAPTFATDRWVYVLHSTPTDNRIVRVRLVGTALDLASEQVLLTGIPRNKFHDGGRLRFGPEDGKLYAAVGDGQNQSAPQDLSLLGGKILRLNPDGSVPSDNPFGNYVWSFGHRNPQGLAFDSRGQLWEQEFGNSTADETNLIVKGGNYGWPRCEGTVGRCSESWLVAPKKTYPPYLGSCSGAAVVRDVLYVACLRGTRLYRLPISGSTLTSSAAYLVGTYGRLRTVEPDAAGTGLWLTTSTKGDKDSIAGNSDEQILHVGLNDRPG